MLNLHYLLCGIYTLLNKISVFFFLFKKDNPRQLGHISVYYTSPMWLCFTTIYYYINAYTLGDIPFKWVKFWSAYLYQPKHPYYDDEDVCIGVMDVICQYCNAMKFKGSLLVYTFLEF